MTQQIDTQRLITEQDYDVRYHAVQDRNLAGQGDSWRVFDSHRTLWASVGTSSIFDRVNAEVISAQLNAGA